MTPEQFALLGIVEIPFDILKIVDSGWGIQSRENAINSLQNLGERYATKILRGWCCEL